MNKQSFICGVLHLSSKVSYGSAKNGAIMKQFTAFRTIVIEGKNYKIFHIKTKRHFNSRDIYTIIRFEKVENDIAMGTVEQYIGEVGDDFSEKEYLKLVCCATWANDKIFLKNMPQYGNDIFQDRKTLPNINIYSIDPPGCSDIDDALHIKKLADDDVYIYELGIHIADVSSYIPYGSDLDKEISSRCETVYLDLKDKRQINMLPDQLTRMCSLIQKEPKRSHSIVMKIDKDYNISNIEFVHCTINVSQNLSYDEAQRIIDSRKNDDLCELYSLGKKILKDNAHLESYDTHKMVEIYMVLANSLVAEKICKKCPERAIFRCHSGSRRQLYTRNNSIGNIDEKIIICANNLLLESAEYKIGNDASSHIALGKEVYTHFTSPIRRYADIIAHRMLDGNFSIDDNTIDQINDKHKLYNKCQKISLELSKIKILKEKYGEVIVCDGYIVDVVPENNRIRIYSQLFDMTIDCKLYSQLLNDLVKKDFVKNEKNIEELKLTSLSNGKKISLEMFQIVKLKIAIVLSIKNKLLCSLLYPNILEIFE